LPGAVLTLSACDDDDNDMQPPMTIMYEQEDQMARPAINTVFVSMGEKDMFNNNNPVPTRSGVCYKV
jgi:hypothetical protein